MALVKGAGGIPFAMYHYNLARVEAGAERHISFWQREGQMKSYKCLMIFSGEGSHWVSLESTDSQVLDGILAEVRKFFPFCRGQVAELPSGEWYNLDIHRLRGKGLAVYWWVVKQLCLQGWEPFAVGKETHCYHLRLEVTDNEEDNDGLLP
jgi:hypothetical protein